MDFILRSKFVLPSYQAAGSWPTWVGKVAPPEVVLARLRNVNWEEEVDGFHSMQKRYLLLLVVAMQFRKWMNVVGRVRTNSSYGTIEQVEAFHRTCSCLVRPRNEWMMERVSIPMQFLQQKRVPCNRQFPCNLFLASSNPLLGWNQWCGYIDHSWIGSSCVV